MPKQVKSLSILKRQRQRILDEGYLLDCWISRYSPGGTAKGKHHYYQLRSRIPFENGKYSRHLKETELPIFQQLVENGRALKRIDKQIVELEKQKLSSRAVLTSSQSDEWYTPPEFIDRARQVMGTIDIDPASNEHAQRWIKATTYYTATDNGLEQPWHGCLWLNPPYGNQTSLWTDKAMAEYHSGHVKQGILLVRPAVGTAWYQRLAELFPCCIPHKRIRFLNEQGIEQSQPVHGNAFFYLGDELDSFKVSFSDVGPIVRPL
ncbi:MAG: DNA N-6-adenine-methyltransferase [Pseudomonadota bacterium]